MSGDYYTFWIDNKIFTDRRIMRMGEAELVTDLLIAAIDGIQSKKTAEKYYQIYDEEFESRALIEERFSTTMNLIGNLFNGVFPDSNLRSAPNFYGLFVALYHMNYGIPRLDAPRKVIGKMDYPKVINCFEEIDSIFDLDDIPKDYQEFVRSTKEATTDIPSRTIRCVFMAKKFFEAIQE